MQNVPNRRHGDGERPPETASVRVLVVEDDEHFRTWIARLMTRLGFTVVTATDGVHALGILRQSAFELLISDFEMPKMNGLELIEVIRDTPALAHQYAVMLTSHDDVEAKVKALTVGYDDFLTKSCTEVEVVAKVIAAKRMLSRQRTLSIAVREWQTLATHDELTGVVSRRTVAAEAERCLAERRALGVALLDLDDFKAINDTYGHLTGDRILRDIGALFQRRTRANDLIGRYGGDEFVLLVTDLPFDDVALAAERLTQEIESLQWTTGETTFAVTATAGTAHSSLIENATLEQLVGAADRDLYAKKWLKKHPGVRPELYQYPQGPAAQVVPLPPVVRERPRAAEEES